MCVDLLLVEAHLLPPKILDPCCGSRMFWFDRQHPNTVFGDIRKEDHILCDGRTLAINPDQLMDFTDIQFPDETFRLVVFDPPHLETVGDKSWMFKKYGRLSGYKWLSEQLEIPFQKTHIGFMSLEECKKVVEICGKYGKC